MITRRELAATAIGGFVALAGCQLYPRAKLRYRMTVEVDTSMGVRTGSSIIESTIIKGPRTGGSGGISYHVRGVAPIVDFPDGKRLFALLTGADGDENYQAHLFNNAIASGAVAKPPMPRIFRGDEWYEERRLARQIKPTVVLPRKLYPKLAWFPIPNDARSIQIVNQDNIENIFGNNTKIKRIYISITEDKFPDWNDKDLPKFGNNDQFAKWLKSMNYDDPRRVGINSLISGEDYE